MQFCQSVRRKKYKNEIQFLEDQYSISLSPYQSPIKSPRKLHSQEILINIFQNVTAMVAGKK